MKVFSLFIFSFIVMLSSCSHDSNKKTSEKTNSQKEELEKKLDEYQKKANEKERQSIYYMFYDWEIYRKKIEEEEKDRVKVKEIEKEIEHIDDQKK